MSTAPAAAADAANALELDSLDADSLFHALGAVESTIPDLLLALKPILAHLTSATADGSADEAGGVAAREAVDRYIDTVDKIQFVLRQAVYYLRETRATPSSLRPAPAANLPRPLAATLQDARGDVELGLYGLRQEAEALREIRGALEALRQGDGVQ
ncbi:hypothetical protein Q5752_006157 [Cryptotrichosporon argae]